MRRARACVKKFLYIYNSHVGANACVSVIRKMCQQLTRHIHIHTHMYVHVRVHVHGVHSVKKCAGSWGGDILMYFLFTALQTHRSITALSMLPRYRKK